MFKIGQAVLQEFETHAYHNFVYRDLYHVCNSGISDVNSNFNVYYESLDAQVPYFFISPMFAKDFVKFYVLITFIICLRFIQKLLYQFLWFPYCQ